MTGTARPPLVALHGFLGCAADWDALFEELERDRRCVAIELPGHGAAPPPPPHDPLRAVAESIVEGTDGLGVVDYLGYSMGGRMLYQLADDPRIMPWRRMVLVGAHPGLRERAARENRRLSDRWLADRIEGGDLGELLDEWYAAPLFGRIKHAAGYAAMRERRMRGEPRHLADALRRLGVAELPSMWERLSRIRGEVLLIAGADDAKYARVNAEAAERLPNVQTATIAHAGHAPQVEQPAEFARVVRAFLDAA